MASLRKRGKTWYVIYSEGGRQRWKAVSTNKRLAEDYLKDMEGKRVRGELMGIKEVKTIRFDDFAKKYSVDYGPNKAQTTRARDQVILDKHLVPFFGDSLLQQITATDIEEYKAQRAACKIGDDDRTIAKSTVNRELDLLKSLLARAVDWDYLRSNPSAGVRKYKLEEREPRFLTPGEGARLIGTARGQMRGFILTALNTGLRKAELFDLK